ncbi:heme ABC exporter ATP-binding protein CcmA [Bombella sp. ESL0385]|uniref:heme ABC exporter ATP-binding protein CcmA n=1 Tax=Bombella sp. ESL0385 TaxID=2676446 RepID=UPI0012D99CE8|nr:heme ABC exporter ATP-binding protein CcmA [Bombella sp. ESL0385]MUG89713.1 heme ABC exporter ATP-binding protein CcmA [Bombella sp. ESL0385]
MHPTPLLSLDHIQLTRAGRCLINDLSGQLYPGDALTLIGPNGVGKSSFLRLIAGLCPPTQGTLTRTANIAWLGTDNALKPTLTVEQNLRLFTPHPITALHEALTHLALTPLLNCPVRLLSYGQKRRVGLARLLLTNAPLWLLDEPTHGLDAQSLALFNTIIATHRAQGGCVMAASHNPLLLPHSHILTLGTATHSITPAPLSSRLHIAPLLPQHIHEGPKHPVHPFLHHLRREFWLALSHRRDGIAGLGFLIICCMLFALALGPAPARLQQVGPGILWVCLLLASLLPLERLYNADAEDGSLDLLRMRLSPTFIALGKIISHWVTSSLPLLLITPLMALFFQLSLSSLPRLILSMTLGSLTLAFLGGMTAAITLGARQNSLLLPILTLPLMAPSLIFGTLACTMPPGPANHATLSLLAAFFLLSVPLCPFIAGLSLRDAQS